MENTIEIPLFPLPIVLFPGMHLPLHIYEEHYKKMIGDCLKSETEFGILLLNNGQLSNVGCTAKVTQIYKQYVDGKLDILTEGKHRFHVLELLQRNEYLEATIEYFDDENDDVPDDLALAEMSPTILVGRMSVPSELEAAFNQAYNTERLPECYKVPGYIRNRRFEAVSGEPKYLTVHEMESVASCESPEWETWRTMETPVWNSQVRPHMVHEEGSPGVYQRIFPT